MNTQTKMLVADVFLIFIAFLRGSTFLVIKELLSVFNPFYIVGIRFLVAGVLLAVLFFKTSKRVTSEELKCGSIIGIFLFLAFSTQTIGLKYTLASKQAFLTSVYVLIIPFILFAKYHLKIKKETLISVLFALGGVGLICLDPSTNFTINLGDGLTLICAFFFACHIIAISKIPASMKIINIVTIQMIFTGLASLLVAYAVADTFNIMSLYELKYHFLYLTIICTLINFLIQNIAQKFTTPTHVGVLLCLEAVFGGGLSVIVLHEEFTLKMILGSILLVLTIIVTELRKNS